MSKKLSWNIFVKIYQLSKKNHEFEFILTRLKQSDRMAQWVIAQFGVPMLRFDSPRSKHA